VSSRINMQRGYLEEIWRTFGDGVRAIIPLFDAEVRGAEMLRRMAQSLFAD
jgi:anion-transporting  ArsA/GET3 family ATPase